MVCDVCNTPQPNCGPWKFDDGRRSDKVCGGCKMRLTLTPERRAALAAEIGRVMGATVTFNESCDMPEKK